MADKAKRGTKRACSGCGAKFYDLNSDPVVCPMCETVYEIKKAEPRKKKAPVPQPKPEEKPKEEEKIAEGEDDLIDIDDSSDDDAQPSEDDDTFLVVEDESENAVSSVVPAPDGTPTDDN